MLKRSVRLPDEWAADRRNDYWLDQAIRRRARQQALVDAAIFSGAAVLAGSVGGFLGWAIYMVLA